jgi:hypothetical protein
MMAPKYAYGTPSPFATLAFLAAVTFSSANQKRGETHEGK